MFFEDYGPFHEFAPKSCGFGSPARGWKIHLFGCRQTTDLPNRSHIDESWSRSGIPLGVVEHLEKLTRRYDVQALKRFDPEARTAMLACFLVEAHKSLLDQLIAMHEQYLNGLLRRSRHAFDERHREFGKRARRGIETVLSAMEILLERRTDDPLIALYRQIDESTLRAALENCREFEHLEDHGLQDELRARYPGLRRYLPAFLELPFRAERGAESLLAVIELARELNRDHTRNLPPDAPDDFVLPGWRVSLYRDKNKTGHADRRLWELALAVAIRDALRSGGLYLPVSRHHVSFSNLIYDEQRWAEDRTSSLRAIEPIQGAGRHDRRFDGPV